MEDLSAWSRAFCRLTSNNSHLQKKKTVDSMPDYLSPFYIFKQHKFSTSDPGLADRVNSQKIWYEGGGGGGGGRVDG